MLQSRLGHSCQSQLALSCIPSSMSKRRRIQVSIAKAGAGSSSAIGSKAYPLGISAVGAAEPEALQSTKDKNYGAFRFWFDERRFKGPGSTCVVHEALYAAGGVRTGGYPKAAPIPGPLGYQRPADWDLLWTPARLALKAAPSLKPGQLICACPGLMSLSRKRKLPCTLHSALGSAAWSIMPRSFTLPDELPELQAHMAARAAAGAGQELWILKTAQHLGKGLKVLPATELYAEASKRPRSALVKPYVMAQRYIDNPLLIEGRKFGIRVWVVVLGPNPLRAYLHSKGLVLFANNEYDSATWTGDGGSVALGHVTNYAQNVDGTVWCLDKLREHLGAAQYQQLWERISHNSALICASALSHMRADADALNIPPESTFEVLGLDFLVDTALQPWLLEVNGTPSLAVDHCQPQVEQLIRVQKGGMVQDLFQLLGVRTRFKPRYEALKFAAKQAATRAKGTSRMPAGSRATTLSTGSADGADDGDDDDLDAGSVPTMGDDSDGDADGADATRTGSDVSAATSVPGPVRPPKSSGRTAGANASKTGPAIVLPKRISEQLAPTSDAAVQACVARELQDRGNWQPLMQRFPLPTVISAGTARAAGADELSQPLATNSSLAQGAADGAGLGSMQVSIPWAQRDLDLRQILDACTLH